MKHFSIKLLLIAIVLLLGKTFAQNEDRNKGVYVEPKSEFYEEIQRETEAYNEPAKKENKTFKADFTNLDLPKSLNEFTYAWHNEQVSQGMTGTCWSFSTTSFFESEVYRLSKEKVKLSEMYTVYWEYVEKAIYYVQQRGGSNFGEGSEADAVPRIWKKYGVVPLESYSGKAEGQRFHDHSKMYKEMNEYLKSVKAANAWNEEAVASTIKSILNHYMGVPPVSVTVKGETLTPKEYLDKVLKLKLDDYVNIISVISEPFYKQIEYKVSDNWWHSKDYYNVTLTEYMDAIKSAVRKGYTICIGGDVSEAGIESHAKVAIVPSFDIPSAYIDEYAREFRINNKTTADDHGIHLVGYLTKNNKDWYLIKDSGAGSKNKDPKGYYFFQEDYVKLKIVDFMIHKDAVKNLLEKFNK